MNPIPSNSEAKCYARYEYSLARRENGIMSILSKRPPPTRPRPLWLNLLLAGSFVAIPVSVFLEWLLGIVASVAVTLVATVFAVVHDHKYAPQEWKDRQALKRTRALPLVLILLVGIAVYAIVLKFF